jgi:hypothetical protein
MGARSPVYGWRQGGSSGGPGGMSVLPQTGVLPMGPPLSPSLRGPMEGPNIPMVNPWPLFLHVLAIHR